MVSDCLGHSGFCGNFCLPVPKVQTQGKGLSRAPRNQDGPGEKDNCERQD